MPVYTTPGQMARMRRDAERLRLNRTCTIRRWQGNGQNAVEITVGTKVPYGRATPTESTLRGAIGVLEAVALWTLSFSTRQDIQVRDEVTDEADGLRFQPLGVLGDPERHLLQEMLAETRT